MCCMWTFSVRTKDFVGSRNSLSANFWDQNNIAPNSNARALILLRNSRGKKEALLTNIVALRNRTTPFFGGCVCVQWYDHNLRTSCKRNDICAICACKKVFFPPFFRRMKNWKWKSMPHTSGIVNKYFLSQVSPQYNYKQSLEVVEQDTRVFCVRDQNWILISPQYHCVNQREK